MFCRRWDFSWPILFILLCLFILSVKLPRGWERIARREPLQAAVQTPLPVTPVKLPERSVVDQEHATSGGEYHSIEPAERIASQPAVTAPADAVSAAPATPPISAPIPDQGQAAIGQPAETATVPVPASQPANEVASIPAPADRRETETPSDDRVVPLPAGPEAPAIHEKDAQIAGSVPTRPSSTPLAPLKTEPQAEVAYPDTGMPVVRPFVPEPAPAAVQSSPPQAEPLAAEPRVAEPKAAQQPVGHVEPVWHEPEALLAEMDALAKHEATRSWAIKTAGLLKELGPAMSKEDKEVASVLDRLEKLSREALAEVSVLGNTAVSRQLLLAEHALRRRISLWKAITEMGSLAAADAQAPAMDPKSMSACLNEIDSLTRGSEEGNAWRRYLLLDALRDWLTRRKTAEERLPGDLAQQVLGRMNHPGMTSHQRQFVASGPVASLHKEVVRHACTPVNASRLLGDLERYERTGLPSDARFLADDCRYLAAGPNEAYRRLAEQVEQHYRNANLRVAISEDLLNRMIPKRPAEYARVEDTVLNVPVRGQSLLANEMAVRLVPDPTHVRLALEVRGEMSSLTSSTSGPATFVNDSESTYTARKPMEIDLKGITLWATEVEVDHDSRLRRVQTKLDPVPILGSVVRGLAERGYEDKKPAADAEVREKIAARAQERIDRETTAQLTQVARQLHKDVLGPVEALLLDPTLLGAETTRQRLVMRIRLAGADQLGSQTPRPLAPADSLASAQIHESVLNNVLQRLDLEGQTFTLAELHQRIAERLHRPAPKPCDPDQEDVKITFAAQNAVRVRCVEGRIEIALSVAKLSKPPRRWKDFQVRAFYRPEVRGRSIELVRDGTIQLIGSRLNLGSQLALRGVFSKVFSQKSPWNVTPEPFVKNPRLDGLAFTQFAIGEGWMAVALGPDRTAAKPAGMRK